MLRRPPRSTLFPYTTSSDLKTSRILFHPIAADCQVGRRRYRQRRKCLVNCRSEEHTSELQSHHDLVCRLLLEKKKKTVVDHIISVTKLQINATNTASTGYVD